MSQPSRPRFALCLAVAAAGCAQGQAAQSHGPQYENDGAVSPGDGGADSDAASPDTGPPLPLDSGSVDASSTDARLADGPEDSGAADGTMIVDSAVDAPADSSAPADTGGDASVCPSALAVVGGSATSAFGAISHGGAWTVSNLAGSAASVPALVRLAGGFHAVFREATTNALAYGIFGSTWSALAPIGAATTIDLPALGSVGAELHLVYRGSDSKFYHGKFSANAWDGATDPVSFGGAQSFGPSAPSAASAGGDLVIAQDGSDGYLYDQSWGTSWMAASQHATAMVGSVAPSLATPNGGAYDLFVVFVHQGDFKLYWSGRAAGAWSAPALIDVNAYTSYPVALAPLPAGHFVMLYEGSNQAPYYSLYDPAATPPWTAPRALVTGTSPILPSPPTVAAGVCGYDAVATYAGTAAVQVVTLSGGTWSVPSPIAGTTGATFAAVATSP
jgi:hypothetical protein